MTMIVCCVVCGVLCMRKHFRPMVSKKWLIALCKLCTQSIVDFVTVVTTSFRLMISDRAQYKASKLVPYFIASIEMYTKCSNQSQI